MTVNILREKIIDYFRKYPLIQIIALFLIWRLIIEIVVWWAGVRVPDAGYPYRTTVVGNPLFSYFAKWDAVYYHDIISGGYRSDILEFLPLFPLIAKLINWVIGNHQLLAAAIAVNLSALGSCLMLYKLARLDEDENFAKRTVFFLLIFPSAFFLAAHYTESLFLFLSLLVFYFARKKLWWCSGIFGFLVSLTRITGILILPALLVDLMFENWRKFKDKVNWKALIPLVFIPLGLVLFIFYSSVAFNRPWAFLEAQKGFGRHLDLNILHPVYNQVITNFIPPDVSKFFEESAVNAFNYFLFWLLFIIFIVLLFKYSRPGYAVLGFLYFIIPSLSGTLISMNRFLLVLFPIYLLLAKIIKPGSFAEKAYIMLSFSLFILLTILFTNGYWVG